MPIQFLCQKCGHKINAPDTAAGKRGKCPKCQQVIEVPLAEPAMPTAQPLAPADEMGIDDPLSIRRPSAPTAEKQSRNLPTSTPFQFVQDERSSSAPQFPDFSMGQEGVNPYQSPTATIASPNDRSGAPSGYRLGDRGSRFVAQLINGLLNLAAIIPAIVVFFMVLPTGARNEREFMQALLTVIWAPLGLFMLCYLGVAILQIIFISQHSASVGKRAMGLQVADARTGHPASMGQYLGVRIIGWTVLSSIPVIIITLLIGGEEGESIGNGLSSIIGLVNLLFIFSASRQCLHDRLAGTIVIEAKSRGRAATQSIYR